MKEPSIDWSIPQRQPAAAILIVVVKALMSALKIVWPFLLVMLLRTSSRSGDRWQFIVLAVSGITIIAAILELIFFRFNILNGELIIRKGIFVKKVIILPLEKIQAVHIDRTWLHKVFNTAQVSFDSGGSEKVEIKISAITLAKAAALKEFITGSASPTVTTAPAEVREPDKLILSLSGKDLLKLSISANHLEAFFILLAFVFSTYDNIENVAAEEAEGFWKWTSEFVQSGSANFILFLVVAVLLVSVTISIVRILLVYLDFRISKSEKGFHIHTGLINVKEKLVPFKKVQYISWKANWVRLKMRLYMLNFHAIGTDQVKERQQVRVPITRDEFIPLIVEHYHPLLPVTTMKPLEIDRSYVPRTSLFRGLLPSLVFVAVAYPFLGYNALWLFLWAAFALLHSWLFQKKFRCWTSRDALQIRKGIYGKEEILLKWRNIQKLSLQQSIYQRKHDLASIRIHTAGGAVFIPYIRHEEARLMMDYGLYKIEADERRG